ncbi:hypothetical protein BAY61_18035 [Prauserella marina]|nr:hypothetical protein BAY61_18035 [Prauserella marina]
MTADLFDDLSGGPTVSARVIRRDAVQGGGVVGDVDAGVSEPVPSLDLRFSAGWAGCDRDDGRGDDPIATRVDVGGFQVERE